MYAIRSYYVRPTGRLHLGHYHGVLKNWVRLQHEFDCFFFVADWHALTTHYEDSHIIAESVWDMVVITAYSIHYTNLYENRHDFGAHGHAAQPETGRSGPFSHRSSKSIPGS